VLADIADWINKSISTESGTIQQKHAVLARKGKPAVELSDFCKTTIND
jgi:hypothetical protein